MEIRRYRKEDCKEIVKLFYKTVHRVCCNDYSKEELDAWAPLKLDLEKWNTALLKNYSLVAIEGDKIVGFADIDESGYLDHLYVDADHQRCKIASTLCDELEKDFNSITTHASKSAKGFFEKRGYEVICEQQVKRKGLYLTNFVMRKDKKY